MLSTVFWALVVLGVLIFVHELGHFLAARWLGVKVLVFSLGFGRRLAGWKDGDGTEYVLSAIPLGGYVKMLGESPDDEEPVPAAEQHRTFGAKGVGARSAIVFAGPLFNFLFAVVALSAIHMVGVEELLPVVGKVTEEMPAAAAGLQPGDRILAIDAVEVTRWEQLSRQIKASDGRALTLAVERAGRAFQLTVQPVSREVPNIFGEPTRTVMIGIAPDYDAVETVKYGVVQALALGLEQTWRMIDLTLTSVWKMLTQVVGADQIGGPLLIADLAGKSASQGASSLLTFMALISVNLGILNLFPVPVLDGGHLLYFGIEAIKGSPVSEKARMIGMRVGMALLGSLMILAFYNDIVRIFTS